MKMRKLLIYSIAISSLLITGCSGEGGIRLADLKSPLPDIDIPGVYSIPIQQGNLITQDMVNQLKPGMTKRQVRYLLGTPILIDTFHENRWDYLYTNKPESRRLINEAEVETRRLRLIFKNDRLDRLVGDIYPQSESLAKVTREKNRERTLVIPAEEPRHDESEGFLSRIWGTVTDEPRTRSEKPGTKPAGGSQ